MNGDRGDDQALVARISGGDRIALELLYRRHASWLLVRLESRCGDPDLADIALQDTFLAVWRSAGKYRNDGAVGAWLWGIAIRRLIDLIRKRRPVPVSPELLGATLSAADTRALTSSLGGAARSAAEFEDTVIDGMEHGEMATAVHDLPADLRAVLLLTAIDGLSTKEAGRVLGIPQGTVKTRLMRARQTVKEAVR